MHFHEAMRPNLSTNKYYDGYRAKLSKEMNRFNGVKPKGQEGAETNSEATTATKNTRQSRLSASPLRRTGSPGYDDIDEAGNYNQASLNDRDMNFAGGLRVHQVEGDDFEGDALGVDDQDDEEAMIAE